MSASRLKIAIVAAEFNKPVVDAMVAAASDEALKVGIDVVEVARIPGCYEIPLIAEALLALPHVQALVVLGYIEKGETQHGEVMGHIVHSSLMEMELLARKPIGLGIIGPGATPDQAEARKSSYARAAVRAAARSYEALRRLRGRRIRS